jgi:O-antigen ligase
MLKIKQVTIEGFLFVIFFVTLMTNGKYRLGDKSFFHFGGAEFAISPFDIPLVPIFIILLLKVLNRKFYIHRDLLSGLVFLYFIMLLPSVFYSSTSFNSLLEIAREVKFIIVFFWLRAFFTEPNTKYYFYLAVIIGISFQMLLSIPQILTGTSVALVSSQETSLNMISGGIARITGSFGHPGMLAQFLNIVIISLLIRWLGMKKGAFHNAYLVFFLLGLVMLISTYSRTALAIEIALILFVLAFSSKFLNLNMQFIKKIGLYIFLGGVFVVIMVVFSDQIVSRFTSAPSESGDIRIVLANIAIKMITENPILGVGLNNFTDVMSFYDSTGLSYVWAHPVHNIYLLIAAEIGLFGLIVFMLKISTFLLTALKVLNSKKKINQESLCFLFAATCGLIAILLSGLMGWSWRLDSIHGFYWIMLAMIGAVCTEYDYIKVKNNYHS